MPSTRNPGRIAGLTYLLIVLLGPIRLIYIPNKLIVHGDAAATAARIAANEMLFRLGMFSDLAAGTILVFVTLALYRLFKDVDRYHAALVVILGGVMPATLYFANVLNDAVALEFVRGADYLSVFDKPQRDAFAMLFLRMHHLHINGAEILWGMWLFPLGILTYRSRFMPRFLGIWLIVNGVSYLLLSFAGLVMPQYENAMFTYGFPAQLGEVVFMLWLLIRGARPPQMGEGRGAKAIA